MADENASAEMNAEVSAQAAPVPAAEGTPAPEAAEKPRRRRTRKAPAAEAAPAVEGAEDAPKPRRRTRKTAPAEDAAVSPEVAQARALAQVSQASVARRQRRAAEQAAEVIGAGDATASQPTDAPTSQGAAEGAVPLVDPALRPHRRGRKPKAYIEAEKAAAAALAAQAAQSSTEAAEAAAPEGDVEGTSDVRPGRSRRTKAKAERTRAAKDAPAPKAAKDAKDAPADAADAPAPEAEAKDAKREGDDAPSRTRGARRTHAAQDAAQGAQAPAHNDRRDTRQQRKQRNNRYNVPTEPTLSRDDLAAMKVAELRDKARELDIDITGKKKPELVEEVYTAAARAEGFRDVEGVLEIANEGFGHLRVHGYMASRDDAFVPANLIRAARLRAGDYITGSVRPSRANDKYPALAKIVTVNGRDPEEILKRPKFSDLTPIYPNEPLKMEHGKDSITGRAIDIVAPVGKGQRGLIVSPPKAGKTTILKKICQAISINNPEVHVICLLVDERPEEVTDMQRSIKGEVVASTFDMPADNHTRVAELVIERAKRIVELGGDVVVVLDSITRLARAYNLAAPASGRILSGGVDSAALYPPKRFLGAARNIENGGSLTILASALIDTGSKMDEVIFEEFKGTGNMELKLDRDLADRRIFPAIDPVASGTRNEDLLIDEQMRPFVWGIRRVLASMSNTERAASAFIKGLRGTNSNSEFLIRSAKRAQEHGDLLP